MAIIRGDNGDNKKLVGTSSRDEIYGEGGNDTLTGLGSNDQLDGGAGTDTAVYLGPQSDYTIRTNARTGVTTVSDNTKAEGSDTLVNIERIIFGDGTIVYLVPNVAPVAASDSLAINEDGSYSSLTSLTANDSDSDGDELEILEIGGVPLRQGTAVITLASGAQLTVHNEGDYVFDTRGVYDHLAQGDTASEEVTYTVTDNHGGVTNATLTITIIGTNDAPVVSAAVTAVAGEDGTISIIDGLANASDVDDGTVLTVVAPEVIPDGVTFNAATNSFAIDPTHSVFQDLAAGENRVVEFTYGVSDGTVTTSATASWTVTGRNDAPVVTGAVEGAASEDGPSSMLGALTNASDVDAGAVLSVVDIPATLPDGVSYDAATRSFTLDPTDAAYQSLGMGQTLSVTITYGVSDGTVTTAASVTWTITGTNDAPVSMDDAGSTSEDAVLSVATAAGVLANDSDVDADDGRSVSAVQGSAANIGTQITLASGALLTMNADGSYSYDPNGQFDHVTVGESTTDSFAYEVSDGNGGTDTATVTITINGVNDAPVVFAQPGDDLSRTINDTSAPTPGWVSVPVYVHYTDPDIGDQHAGSGSLISSTNGSTLGIFGGAAVSAVSGMTPGEALGIYQIQGATLDQLAAGETVTEVGRIFVLDDSTGNFSFLTAGYIDVTFTLVGVNDDPIAGGDLAGTTEDAPLLVGSVATNDYDVDNGAILSYVLDGSAPAGLSFNADGSWTFNPADAAYQSLAQGEELDVVIPYTVIDEHGASDNGNLTITVTGVNDAPVVSSAMGGQTLDAFLASHSADQLLVNDGSGLFTSTGQMMDAGFALDVQAGDLDGDGDFDVITGNSESPNTIWLNDGTGHFVDTGQRLGPGTTQNVALGDLDGDGDLDAVFANREGSDPNELYINDGAGNFTLASANLGTEASFDVDLADFDLDGDLDVLVVNRDAASRIYFNDGSGGFVDSGQLLPQGGFNSVVGDLNGDGFADALIVTIGVGSTVHLNDGTGTLVEVGYLPTSGATSVAFGDVDSDGDLDAFVTIGVGDGGPDLVYLNDGVGNFSDSGQRLGMSRSFDVALGDVDADGDLDAYTTTIGGGPHNIWLNDGSGNYTGHLSVAAGSASSVALADFESTTPALASNVIDVDEDGPASSYYALTGAVDADADPLSVVVPAGLPAGVTFDAVSASFALDPSDTAYQGLAEGDQVSVTVTYGITDGTATITASVTWTVTGTNDAPIAQGDMDSIDEDVELRTGNVLSNDSDVDVGDVIEVVSVRVDPNTGTIRSAEAGQTLQGLLGTLVVNPDGTYFYTLNSDDPFVQSLGAGAATAEQFFYTVRDSSGALAEARLSIAVRGVNDAPIVSGAGSGAATEGGDVSTLYALANASDVDSGTALAVVDIQALPDGVIYDEATNSFTLDPAHVSYDALNDGETATVSAHYAVSDGITTTPASVTWTIEGRSDAPEFQVNSQTQGNQRSPSVTDLANGGFVVTWVTVTQTGSLTFTTSLHGQIYDSTGAAVGAEFQVNSTAYSDNPEVMGLSDGRFIVLWSGQLPGPGGTGIYARVYTAAGEAMGPEFLISQSIHYQRYDTEIAELANGGFVISWTSTQNPDGWIHSEIYARTYDADWLPTSNEFEISTTNHYQQLEGHVVPTLDGGFIAIWSARGPDDYGIFAQRYDAHGNRVGSTVLLAPGDSGGSIDVASQADGSFVLVFSSYQTSDGNDYGVWARTFSASLSPTGSLNLVNTNTAGGQLFPSVSASDNGGYFVTWMSNTGDGSGSGIFGRALEGDGAPVGPEVQLNGITEGNQQYPDVTFLNSGEVVAVWVGPDANSFGIYGRIIESTTAAPPDTSITTLNAATDIQAIDDDSVSFTINVAAPLEPGLFAAIEATASGHESVIRYVPINDFSTPVIVTGLDPSTAYSFTVVLRDPAGNTSNTIYVEATTVAEYVAPTVSFGEDFAVDEDAGTITVTVTRTGDLSQSSTVNWAYTSPTTATPNINDNANPDFTGLQGSQVVFAAGQESATISIAIIDDSIEEAPETITLSIISASNAAIGDASVTVTISANDAPPPDTTAPTISNIAYSVGDDEITVTFDTSEDATAEVLISGSDGTLFEGQSATLGTSHSVTFTGLAPNTTYSIGIRARDAVANAAVPVDGGQVTTLPPAPADGPVALSPFEVIDAETGSTLQTADYNALSAAGEPYDFGFYGSYSDDAAVWVSDVFGGATMAFIPTTEGELSPGVLDAASFSDGSTFGFYLSDSSARIVVEEPDGDRYVLTDFALVDGALTFTMTDL